MAKSSKLLRNLLHKLEEPAFTFLLPLSKANSHQDLVTSASLEYANDEFRNFFQGLGDLNNFKSIVEVVESLNIFQDAIQSGISSEESTEVELRVKTSPTASGLLQTTLSCEKHRENVRCLVWFHTKAHKSEKETPASNANEKKKFESRYLALFDSQSIGMLISSSNGRIQEANSYFLELIGRTKEYQEENINWIELTPAAYKETVNTALEETLTRGWCPPFETQFTSKENEVSVLMGMVRSQSEDPEVLAYVIDITNQKEVEKEVLQAATAKSVFATNVSHEIRTPLNAICGMIELLIDSNLNPRQQDFANTILRSSETLRQMIHDVLDFSKIEARKYTVESSQFSVKFLVEDVVELLGASANSKKLDLIANVDIHHDSVIGDAGKLRQILLNLIGNSIKFTCKGHVVVSLKMIEEDDENEVISFSVEDTGMGISEEDQKHLFQPFFQANKHIPGTGLGLPISKQLLQLMESDLEVKSEVGVGSIFSFKLKVKKSNEKSQLYCPFLACRKVHTIIYQVPNIVTEAISRYLDNHEMKYHVIKDDQSLADLIRDLDRSGTRAIIVSNGEDKLENLINIVGKEHSNTKILVINHGKCLKQHDINQIDSLCKPLYQSKFVKGLCNLIERGEEASSSLSEHLRSHVAPDGVVLLAEDNLVNQKVAGHQLERLGYRYQVANNGNEVLQYLKENDHHYSAILMDCQMPVMDGLACSTEIRKIEKREGRARMPILALTAFHLSEFAMKCAEAGMDDFISKPTSIRELKEKLTKWIQ